MNIGRAQWRITLWVILPAILLYFALRVYSQIHHVDVYVSRVEPMPAELAAGLHMEEHKISPVVHVESPYDRAPDKILSGKDIQQIRHSLAWSGPMPIWIDALAIIDTNHVVARRNGKQSIVEYQLSKQDGQWLVDSVNRHQVQRFTP